MIASAGRAGERQGAAIHLDRSPLVVTPPSGRKPFASAIFNDAEP